MVSDTPHTPTHAGFHRNVDRTHPASPASPHELAAARREADLLKTILSKEQEATKLRLDVTALETRASDASEQGEAIRKKMAVLEQQLRKKEMVFEQRQHNLAAQAKAYKKMVGDMHRVLESAERKRTR